MIGRHPMENRWSRRQFLGRAVGGAIAVPSLAAILAACEAGESGGGGSGPSLSEIPIATLENPVQLL